MARHRKRFKRLDEQYRLFKGVIPDDQPELKNYIEWRKGNRKIKVNKELSGEQRKRYGFAILPFNKELGEAAELYDYFAAPITAYSNEARKTKLSLSDADLGYKNIDGATFQDNNFFPALLRVFVKDDANSVSVDKTSDITGGSYKRHPGSTYTIPFGRSLEGDKDANVKSSGEDNVKNALLAKIKNLPIVGSVSYEPEVFRAGRILASPTTA